MRTIISVSKSPRTREYELTIQRPKSRPYTERVLGGAEGAAAIATSKAIGCDCFVIVADREVMNLIPSEMGGNL